MNKYKVIYYLSIVVFIVNLLAMIGSLFGCSTRSSCHPFVHECCTVAKNKTLF